MEITQAQKDIRLAFQGGFAGQLVSGLIWLTSAAAATWGSPRLGIAILLGLGFFVFPITQAVLKLLGQAGALPAGHPMNQLATQIAFTAPLNIPVVLGATLYRESWFYPAFLIIIGTHYLPFVFLYGQRLFAVLAGLMWATGVMLALYGPRDFFSLGGWLGGLLLLIFAVILRNQALQETRA